MITSPGHLIMFVLFIFNIIPLRPAENKLITMPITAAILTGIDSLPFKKKTPQQAIAAIMGKKAFNHYIYAKAVIQPQMNKNTLSLIVHSIKALRTLRKLYNNNKSKNNKISPYAIGAGITQETLKKIIFISIKKALNKISPNNRYIDQKAKNLIAAIISSPIDYLIKKMAQYLVARHHNLLPEKKGTDIVNPAPISLKDFIVKNYEPEKIDLDKEQALKSLNKQISLGGSALNIASIINQNKKTQNY